MGFLNVALRRVTRWGVPVMQTLMLAAIIWVCGLGRLLGL